MTIRAKQVHTARMQVTVNVVAGAGWETYDGADMWSPDEDVTVIGGHMDVFLEKMGVEFDSGIFQAAIGVGNQAKRGKGDEVFHTEDQRDCFQTTVGVNVNTGAGGAPAVHHDVMFPEGYGIDVDAEDAMYVNWSVVNDQAGDHTITAWVMLFYVLR